MAATVEDLKKYIKKYLTKGYNVYSIKNALLEAGFSKDMINQAMAGVIKFEKKKPAFEWIKPAAPKTEAKPQPATPETIKKTATKDLFDWLKPGTQQKTKKIESIKKPQKPTPIKIQPSTKPRNKIAVVLLILFFVAIGIVIWLFPATCVTESCFIMHANNCDAATFRNKIDGTIMSYQTNDCFIIKTVEKMNPSEPPLMRERFEGKSMTCSYNKGDFDPLYVNTISAHLNTCQGALREEIIPIVK